MGWNGSGDFQRTHNFSADSSAGIKILATRQDAEWSNFETGLENCLTRDGQNTPSVDLPMAGQKHSNVGPATSATHYLRADQFLRNFPVYCAFGGDANAMSASAQFALTSLTAGVQVLLLCPSVNTTTSVTLGLTGASTATVLRADGKGPARGQVKGLHRYVYDGTNWIITDPSPVTAKIMVSDPSASVATGSAVSWNATNSADGFQLSATAVQIPGGIRTVRIYSHIFVDLGGASASGIYFIEPQYDSGSGYGQPKWAGTSVFVQANTFIVGAPGGANPEPTVNIHLPLASVSENSRIRLRFGVVGTVTTPASAQDGFMCIEAID